LDEDTGLYYFGARYYDARTSVWASVDPILGDYLNGKPNGGIYVPQRISLYSYVLNNPLKFIDPDGLTDIAVAAFSAWSPDEPAFVKRAKSANLDKVIKVNTGQQFLKELANNSSRENPITKLSVFSHSWFEGIFMNEDEGFYGDKEEMRNSAASLDDLKNLIDSGDIVFSKDAVITLYGCGTAGIYGGGADSVDQPSFARRLSEITGATVIGSTRKVSPDNTSVLKNEKNITLESGNFKSDGVWKMFQGGKYVKNLGNEYSGGVSQQQPDWWD